MAEKNKTQAKKQTTIQPKVKEKKEVVDKTKVAVVDKVPARLYEKYKTEIVPAMMQKFGYKNIMQVPKIEKVVVNVGAGAATQDPKIIEDILKDLTAIVGQKPSIRKAKKSISNFKLREGAKIGVAATLRSGRMYEFMDRLINLALPKVRDFKGVSDKAFDGRGNYTLGIKEHPIFPEINLDKVVRVFGMDITFVTTANTDAEAYELLKLFGMPFRKKEGN
ncbi:MAG TPA: 50S ribosomal protein L5 [Ignavibacteriales bacterium]|nr:50S ribosomal protein L5 [Ignavibacteriales bacterium]HOL80168.1 50S ribosomal protein L5 [Ignavibacteriales bacterium]HOM64450.1 50S ribosomal protein L5 [Ignavibacteriales bacterium]HPD67937.1 50S ribosomal protein L5 [Ignavibacteriales bacterium]HPP32357.1 50S ribosomal protein L5 [Ignavibacteriales bacterium]